jgi:hypothetical protein
MRTLRKSQGMVIISQAEVVSHTEVAHSTPISLPYCHSSRCCSTVNSRNSRCAPYVGPKALVGTGCGLLYCSSVRSSLLHRFWNFAYVAPASLASFMSSLARFMSPMWLHPISATTLHFSYWKPELARLPARRRAAVGSGQRGVRG